MKLEAIRLSGFRSFGEETEITLSDQIFLIGPNGSGKTAVLQALCRLFAFESNLRKIQTSDFYIPLGEEEAPEERSLYIEADIHIEELEHDDDVNDAVIPPCFQHMRMDDDGRSYLRYRLEATMGREGDIDEVLSYVTGVEEDGSLKLLRVSRPERNLIRVHYLPAKRDPANHVSLSVNALLGRLLHAINWTNERDHIGDLSLEIDGNLSGNSSISAIQESISESWGKLHKGEFFRDPALTFSAHKIEQLLKYVSLSFSPGHDEPIDFTRLSDGQKSMLYLSLVLAFHDICKQEVKGDRYDFDPSKLNSPAFTILAMEEPENSLSPHYLGRIMSILSDQFTDGDGQSIVATHAPSMLSRVEPENVRYLRLDEERRTLVRQIVMPTGDEEAQKFVRSAVKAYPEVYFARLVVLGEGDSELIVLPKLFAAKGLTVDEFGICIAPLGGRHVHHFWRLLNALDIPYFTLLDLDLCRYLGGWGRIKAMANELRKIDPSSTYPPKQTVEDIPNWNSTEFKLLEVEENTGYLDYLRLLSEKNIHFSMPLDLDFSMLDAYPNAYGVDTDAEAELPSESTLKAVLGKSFHDDSQYTNEQKSLFGEYHRLFKLGSKPAAHINAILSLTDGEVLAAIPESLGALIDDIADTVGELPE